MEIVEQYLLQLNTQNQRFRRSVAFLTVLSFLVVVLVSWNLRQTGITLANGANCGIEEHQHEEACILEKVLICGYDVPEPTEGANEAPIETPTDASSEAPTEEPTEEPPTEPTEPSSEPTVPPTEPTEPPTEPTEPPTEPTEPPTEPTEPPTEPTEPPTEPTEPSSEPTEPPTEPTEPPTEPTEPPTEPTEPSSEPTEPSTEPTEPPTEPTEPSSEPTVPPTEPTEPPTEPTEPPTEPTEPPTEPTEPSPEPTEPSTEPTEPSSEEHIHTEDCYQITYSCELEEHIHQITCYSDINADLEDWDIWAATTPERTGNISVDMVLVAQSQLGCTESNLNFELAEDGETRNGITRYGQWYGNPYGPWSNMFTSFVLRYAGLNSVPINSGAEKMQLEWEKLNLYRHAGGYEPAAGDIVFLDKNQNGVPESTAVVVGYFDFILTVIEGDVDNTVVQSEYHIEDPVITGYGITNPGNKLMVNAAAASDSFKAVGQATTYNNTLLTSGNSLIIYTTGTDGATYAIDGNGNAVELKISNGVISADVEDPRILYWNLEKADNYEGKTACYIRNVLTGVYIHPNQDAGSAGSLHTGKWETAFYNSGNGARLRGARQSAYALLSDSTFTYTTNQNEGSIFYFGLAPSQVTLWLDGTNGNIMSYRGSDNTANAVYSGVEMKLPSTWKAPRKYDYRLAGWVNIQTGDYYLPGDGITVTENTVLYADWVASTYDIGQYNADVTNTISTNDFITTHVFDYSSLINLHSSKVSVNVSSGSHSETWSHVASGTVSFKNHATLDFSFNDHDSGGTITNLNNLNNPNKYTGGTGVYSGIYNDTLGEVLFGTDNLYDPETGEGIVGKHYLGQGDYLFQINTDPASEYYGYYYYDAKLNAASYNQTDQRFYVYDYLERTSDSANNNDAGKYSDFLPLNSPYANTNGQGVHTYTYNGEHGEYSGTDHYYYDARYDANGSSSGRVKANLWFGMRTDVQFGLPDDPGVTLADGSYGNKDIYGNDMHFLFTGDDDVWILIDGKVALDLGGIHQAAEGDINFSTGEVRVNGKKVDQLSGVESGEHTLSILYLERGSSMSNCAIYFNLAPRFSLTLQKEDVLTQEILNGAQFAFYHDQECTLPCELWPSHQSYKNDEPATNLFTIQNGQVYVWGLSPSRTYYIKEVAPPDASGYDPARGVIKLTLDKKGLNSHSATILDGIDQNGNRIPASNGFTIHGFRIDEENQAAYIVITNAQNWVTETTSVYVEKKWNDSENHTYDAVTVFLNVTDPDGTVRRIREIQLNEENDWKYTWTNLPKYTMDPETGQESKAPVVYTVSEAYIPGYSQSIHALENGMYEEETWAESGQFVNGESYILKTSSGCLSTVSATGNTLQFVTEAEAKESSLAIWKATVSSGLVRLENQAGQSLNFYSSGWTRYFNATTGQAGTQNFTPQSHNSGIRLYYTANGTNYYLGNLNNQNYAEAKRQSQANSALVFYPMERRNTTTVVDIDGYGFSIVNTPLTDETSLTVTKKWEHPLDDNTLFEKEQVTFLLLANGVDTNRKETVNLQNNWTVTFHGLPYYDEDGEPYVYTVVELWEHPDWIPVLGDVESSGGDNPTYSTTVINVYRWTNAVVLPSTGGIGYPLYILIGLALMSAPFVYGFRLRRRYGKGISE